MVRLLPLFPLQLVALPGCAIPLHIFEERYRLMVGEAEAAGSEFGIVLAKDGGVVKTGCTVAVESVTERYPDGRFDVVTRGRRRFTLLALDNELDYLQGEVEYFDDDDFTLPDSALRNAAMEAYPGALQDPSAARISFQLAHSIGEANYQSLILPLRSETLRLRHLLERARIKSLAPRNGSGHQPVAH